jgi:chromosome segregation ATPase
MHPGQDYERARKLTAQVRRLETERDKLKRSNDALTKECHRLREYACDINKHADRESRHGDMAIAKLERDLESAESTIAALTKRAEEAERERDRFEGICDAFADELEPFGLADCEAFESIRELARRVTEARGERDAALSRVSELASTPPAIEIALLQKERDDLRAKLAKAQELADHRVMIEIERGNLVREAIEKQRQAYDAAEARFAREIADARSIDQHRFAVSVLSNTESDLRAKLEAAEAERVRLDSECRRWTALYQDGATELDEARKEAAYLRDMGKAYQASEGELRRKLEAAESRIDTLAAQLDGRTGEVQALRKLLAKTDPCEECTDELAKCREELANMTGAASEYERGERDAVTKLLKALIDLDKCREELARLRGAAEALAKEYDREPVSSDLEYDRGYDAGGRAVSRKLRSLLTPPAQPVSAGEGEVANG